MHLYNEYPSLPKKPQREQSQKPGGCCAGIKGIWNLQNSSSASFDTYLVLAFVGETRILEINAEDELDEAEIEGFDAEQQVRAQIAGVHTDFLPFEAIQQHGSRHV